MTTKEYVKKYKLDISNKFDHSEFVKDLASDFIALLELNKANNNIKGFDNAVRCIKMKFDAISNKTAGVTPERLWNYFYATVIVKMREELCPRDMQRRREEQERKKNEWEERKRLRDWEDSFWERSFFSFLFGAQKNKKPVNSFTVLGLPETATESEIKTAYKKLAIIHHPDRGGKQESFIEITEAKNKCLDWLLQH